jgi:hypothetical protein
MIYAYLCRFAGLASFLVLILNVRKHGWHAISIFIGLFLTLIMFSLGVAPERRQRAWDVRFVIAVIAVAGLAAFRFLH